MAVKKKAVVKKKKAKEANGPEFTIDDAAKIMEVKPSTARMKFRDAEIKKTGRAYGWNSEAAMKADIKKVERAGARD